MMVTSRCSGRHHGRQASDLAVPGRPPLPPGAYGPRRGSPRTPPMSTSSPEPGTRRSAPPRRQRSRRRNGQRQQQRARPIPASGCSGLTPGLPERRRSRRRHRRASVARAPRSPEMGGRDGANAMALRPLTAAALRERERGIHIGGLAGARGSNGPDQLEDLPAHGRARLAGRRHRPDAGGSA